MCDVCKESIKTVIVFEIQKVSNNEKTHFKRIPFYGENEVYKGAITIQMDVFCVPTETFGKAISALFYSHCCVSNCPAFLRLSTVIYLLYSACVVYWKMQFPKPYFQGIDTAHREVQIKGCKIGKVVIVAYCIIMLWI